MFTWENLTSKHPVYTILYVNKKNYRMLRRIEEQEEEIDSIPKSSSLLPADLLEKMTYFQVYSKIIPFTLCYFKFFSWDVMRIIQMLMYSSVCSLRWWSWSKSRFDTTPFVCQCEPVHFTINHSPSEIRQCVECQKMMICLSKNARTCCSGQCSLIKCMKDSERELKKLYMLNPYSKMD